MGSTGTRGRGRNPRRCRRARGLAPEMRPRCRRTGKLPGDRTRPPGTRPVGSARDPYAPLCERRRRAPGGPAACAHVDAASLGTTWHLHVATSRGPGRSSRRTVLFLASTSWATAASPGVGTSTNTLRPPTAGPVPPQCPCQPPTAPTPRAKALPWKALRHSPLANGRWA